MGYSEFVRWQAFARIEPIGDARQDLQSAIVASTIANVNRRKRSQIFKPSQFVIDFWKQAGAVAQQRNWQSIKQTVVTLNTALGGKDNRQA